MKYNGKMAVAVTLVAWGLDEFYDGYPLAGLKDEGRDMVRWGTDYLLKTITGERFATSQWAKSPKNRRSAFLLIRHSNYSAILIHSYRLLFRRFCPLGNISLHF